LAKELTVPLLARDTIKESLFDSLGHSDRAWSMKLGAASYDVLFSLAEASFHAGAPCVMLEANFTERAGQQLQALADRHGVSLIQVFCHATPEVLWQRFQHRVASGERHPGHVDGNNFEEARMRITQTIAVPLGLKGPLIDVDTSAPSEAMHATALSAINTHIAP
jgi:predicted kinase